MHPRTRTRWTRRAAALCFALTGAIGCSSCPPPLELDTPEHTLATFRHAFECDQPDMEYRCFSEGVQGAFGGLAGYQIGSAIFREENGTLVFLLKIGPDGPPPTIKPVGDGSRVRATFDSLPTDAFGQSLTFELLNQPEYILHYANGEEVHDFADSVVAVREGKDQVRITLRDADLGKPLPVQIQRVEIRPRWVIDGIPGLMQAIDKAHGKEASP